MTPESSSDSPRDEAFMKIGRNIVNFQRIEMMLKQLVIAGGVSGTTVSFEKNFAKKKEFIGKRSMGQLTEAFHAEVFGASPDCGVLEPGESGFAFGCRLHMNSKDERAFKDRLKALTTERNQLIHHDLAGVNFKSDEECQQLSAILEEQNGRILKEMDWLRSQLKGFRDMKNTMFAYMQTDEFAERMKRKEI
jgi:hypothetical protein